MKRKITSLIVSLLLPIPFLIQGLDAFAVTSTSYKSMPPFITSGAPPLVMLVMGRNHKLYYEAYNDASDLNDDGQLDIRYSPDDIDYYGYFDNYKCYTYNSSSTPTLFEPTVKTTDKKCSGTARWSGDFLNYLTMSRMDTMRKVLYGGYRSTDSTTETILQRVYVPQDAHTWGKEYTSIAVDGYDIADYTPYTPPVAGLRHLFASTTLSANGTPILRVAESNTHRIWNWVAKESPVADDSIASPAGGFPGHPYDHSAFEDMVNTYATATNLFGSGSWLDYNIRNHVGEKYPSPDATDFGAIDGYGNPWGASGYIPHNYAATDQDNYLAIFTGNLKVNTGGSYEIAVDGDDAVEVIIDGGTPDEQIIGFYGAHGWCQCTTHRKTINLSAGTHTVEFRMEEAGGADRYHLYWNGPDSGGAWSIIPAASFTDLTMSTYKLQTPSQTIVNLDVRVKVCDPSVGLESNCKQYPDGNYKPIGLLQRHGETQRMYFGLMTGSYAKNTSGGVLRKQIGDISDEIIANTGQFDTSTNGIIQTINKLRIYGYNYGARYYNLNCGWITGGPMSEGQCRDWGNPVAEMMYETQRYFAGKNTPTTMFDYSGTTDDTNLGLPKPGWNDPYDTSASGFESCSKPFMLVLSDINPTYDSDNLPGVDSNFTGTAPTPNDLTGLDVSALADDISTAEGISGNRYIGQSGSIFDGACTVKNITGFGDIRGLCPEEPTKGGGYYSAAVAYYGHTTDLQSTVADDQKVTTYAVGLASPLPRIDLNVGGDSITLVPFAKTVGSNGTSTVWNYWPTNTIVDFFVETLTPTSGIFRINYEDVEQGADHDMDDIVAYRYQLVDSGGNAVTDPLNATAVDITLKAGYASGSYIQHAGYIISGTTADGTYLEVTDTDTSPSSDFLVALDTPPGAHPLDPTNTADQAIIASRDQPGQTHNPSLGVLPTNTTRRFFPDSSGGATVAQLLEGPLWYAAKWGAFEDKDGSNTPNDPSEWDKDGDGIPDTYFYVTNPLRLEEQLNKSFASILEKASSGTAASVISNTRSGEGAIYQSIFFPSKTDSTSAADTVNWAGQVHALQVDAYGNIREDTLNNKQLDLVDDYIIQFSSLSGEEGKVYRFQDVDGDQQLKLDPDCAPDACVDIRIDPLGSPVDFDTLAYLWNSTDWLNPIADGDVETQRTFLSNTQNRYIFTWVDGNGDNVVDASETMAFEAPTDPTVADLTDSSKIFPYLHLYPTFTDTPAAITALTATDLSTFLIKQSRRVINFIRGSDCADDTSSETCNAQPLTVNGTTVNGTAMRSRQYDSKTWRLGDIIYSTPTLVGRPAEGYHLLYRDKSYAPFAARYQKRRNIIYTGANDGMVHAFNGGFYDSRDNKFLTSIEEPFRDANGNNTWDSGEVFTDWNGNGIQDSTMDFDLGAELWAYVPFNLLPHLYWLTESSYDEKTHVYYVDQKPRIFDARIFFQPGTTTALDDDHPNGWGTIMVVGMRFGGGSIAVDMDKTDGAYDPNVDPTMKSAFMIFDITNPEKAPKLLAEITMPEMGFATSYPTVVITMDGDKDKNYKNISTITPGAYDNKWYLAFGSGPADANGDPGTIDSTTAAYDNTVLATVESQQPAGFYMLDLVKLATDNELWTLTDGSGPTAVQGALDPGLYRYVTLDADSFVSAPVTVDYDLDYNADFLYFGTISGTTGNWGGKLRRIIIDNDYNPINWHANDTLIDPGQPITAAPSVGVDDDGKNWVFFGTGRYFNADDKADTTQQSYYGIKEPVYAATHPSYDPTNPLAKSWDPVTKADLVDVTNYEVYTDRTVTDTTGTSSVTDWNDLITEQSGSAGWYLDFPDSGERNLGQAALIGGLLSFTTFTPESNVCNTGGSSALWALYYKTGTAHYSGVLNTGTGTPGDLAYRKMDLGAGMATSPSIHTNRQEGSTVFVQSSTGKITRIEEKNPQQTKSGMKSWRLR